MADNKLNDMISTSLEKIKELVDAQTIIGEPINTQGGTVIIPVSKITVGYASGGVDYNSKNAAKLSAPAGASNFGGGGGTGISVSPVAFLTVSPSGCVDLLTLANPQNGDIVDKFGSVLERTPDIIEKIKAVFSKKKTDAAADKDTAAAEPSTPDTKAE